MITSFEVRFLLELWNFAGNPIELGKLNKCFSVPAATANATRERLMKMGLIEAAEKGKKKAPLFNITDAGQALLKASLVGDDFQVESQIGKRTANVLLKWWRSQSSTEMMAASNLATIASYEAFKSVALETYDRLNRDFNLDNLVPIYRIRREIEERVARSEFDRWLLEMQSKDIFQLLEGSVEDNAPDKLEDSVQTKLGKLRCYAKRIKA